MLVYLAVLVPVLVLFCGLSVDVAMLQMNKLRMQSANDAAALAAELELERSGTGGNFAAAAKGDAGLGGFTDGSNNTTVTVTKVPNYGSFSGFYDAVQVSVSSQFSTYFLKLLGTSATTITTRSTAVVTPCLYVNSASSLATYSLGFTSSTISSSCPYYINSASTDSGSTFSGAGVNISGDSSRSSWAVSSTTPPRYGARVLADPLRNVTQPTASTSCATTDYSLSNTSGAAAGPGTYCGTTTLTGSSIGLYPGLYAIAGSLVIDSSTLSGSGVTFFFTKNPSNGSYGTLTIRNNSTLTFSAPTDDSSGGVPGVLFMTDRNFIHTSAQDFQITGSSVNADGVWYLTGAGLLLSNSATLTGPNYVGIDADNLQVKNSTLRTLSNFSNVSGGNVFRPIGGLVE